jgi:hypothetical protein
MAGASIDCKLIILTALILQIVSCRNSSEVKSVSDTGQHLIVQRNDTTFLFNGVSLDGWEITNFGPQGPVYVTGGQIILGMGEGCTGITWTGDFPGNNYRVSLEAKRIAGNDFFCGMTFLVGKEPCTLIVGGWAGTTVGLSSINNKDASENETTTYMTFEKNRWYKICLTVAEESIRAFIDDQVVVDYMRKEGDILSVRPEVELSRPFGIASWYTTAGLRNIKIVRIEK